MIRAKKDYWTYRDFSRPLIELLNNYIRFEACQKSGSGCSKEFLVYAGQQSVRKGESFIANDDVILPTPTFSLKQEKTYWELTATNPLIVPDCARLRFIDYKTVLSVSQFVGLMKFKEETSDQWALDLASSANDDNIPVYTTLVQLFEERKKLLEDKDFLRFNVLTRSGKVYPVDLPFIGFRKNYMVLEGQSDSEIFHQVGAGFCGVAIPDGKENEKDNDNYFQKSHSSSALILTDYTSFFSKSFVGFDSIRPQLVIKVQKVIDRAKEIEITDSFNPEKYLGVPLEEALNPFVPIVWTGVTSETSDSELHNYAVMGFTVSQIYIIGTYDIVTN